MKKLLVLLLLCPLIGFCQSPTTLGYHRVAQVFARAPQGVTSQVVPYASVTVTVNSTGAPATIYSDPQLSQLISPPTITADDSGNYDYYLPLSYLVAETISFPGQGSLTINNIGQYAGSGGGVSQIVAGANITLSPSGGTGVVTISNPNATFNPASPGPIGASAPSTVNATTITATTVDAATMTAQSVNGVVVVQATGNNIADDTAAFQSAVTQVCAGGPNGYVEVPMPDIAYRVLSPLSPCNGLQIRGIGDQPIVKAPNGFLVLSGIQNLDISNLDIQGSGLANIYGIRGTASIGSALNNHYHDNIISGYGNGTTGGGISIEGDSLRNTIDFNTLSNNTANISITGNTDGLDVADNIMDTPVGGSGRCIDANTPPGGSATQLIRHNIFFCEGLGAIRLQGLGSWIVVDNESETLLPFSNASNASYEFLSATSIHAERNTNFAHGYGQYDYYVGDTIIQSTFYKHQGAGATLFSWRVGAGIDNRYEANQASSGPSTLYSTDYAGIVGGNANSGFGQSFGCASSAIFAGMEFCTPTLYTLTPGTSSTFNFQGYTPALGTGNSASFVLGVALSTNNSLSFNFNNVGGAGSALNTMTFGIVNGSQITVTPTGKLNAPGGLTSPTMGNSLPACTDSGGTLTTSGTPCTAPSVSAANMTSFPNSIPTVGTPTAGQAACIKSAGPPIVIGYCSTVVGAGGACTCN